MDRRSKRKTKKKIVAKKSPVAMELRAMRREIKSLTNQIEAAKLTLGNVFHRIKETLSTTEKTRGLLASAIQSIAQAESAKPAPNWRLPRTTEFDTPIGAPFHE